MRRGVVRLSPGVSRGDPGGDVYGDQGLGDGLAPTPHTDGELSQESVRRACASGSSDSGRHRGVSRPPVLALHLVRGELQGTRRPVR